MSDKIEVSPTPIQRNALDVATELTKLYYERFSAESKEEIAEVFLLYYSTVKAASNPHIYPKDLINYMPESLKKIIDSK